MSESRPWYLSAPPGVVPDADRPAVGDRGVVEAGGPSATEPPPEWAQPDSAPLVTSPERSAVSDSLTPPPPIVSAPAQPAERSRSAPTTKRPNGRSLFIGGAAAVLVCVAAAVAVVLTQHHPTAAGAQPGASAVPQATVRTTEQAAASTSTSPTPTSAPRLSRAALAGLTLTSGDVSSASAGLSVANRTKSSYLTLKQYRAGYRSTTEPTSCAVARGLMVFTDSDGPASSDWSRPVILREQNLRLASSSQIGSQQIRQFASADAAIEFMQRQHDWFADCGHVVFSWPGSTGTVSYDGGIVAQQGSDELLAQGAIGGLSSGATSEFDGWVRHGSIVYASYLLGDASTSSADLAAAGHAVADAVAAKLDAVGAQ